MKFVIGDTVRLRNKKNERAGYIVDDATGFTRHYRLDFTEKTTSMESYLVYKDISLKRSKALLIEKIYKGEF